MGKFGNRRKFVRGPEYGSCIDVESERALRRIDTKDPRPFKKLLKKMEDGKKIWGPQAPNISGSGNLLKLLQEDGRTPVQPSEIQGFRGAIPSVTVDPIAENMHQAS